MAGRRYTGKEFFCNTKQCETLVFPWGTLEWTIEPRIQGTQGMTGGMVTLLPGLGHSTHHHVCDEVLYMIDGKDCEQYIILEDGTRTFEMMQPGDFVFIPKMLDHGTVNRGPVDVHMVAVYAIPGSEAELALQADKIIPPEE